MPALLPDAARTAPPFRPGWSARFAAMRPSRAIYGLVSLLLLAPCHWQPRLQAGDLSSHIDNSWLARLIESGRAQGLEAVRQTSNFLFDLILGGLFKVVGAEAARRIAVSLAILTFAWGAFAFISTVSGRRAWHLMPVIGMLAYGWVFQMGFFDFYLSLGLCFWALALGWESKPWRLAAAGPILALAYLAHALPVVWAAGLLAYLWLAGRTAARTRAWMIAVSLLAMVLLRAWTGGTRIAEWSLQRICMTSAADPSWTFDAKYYVLLVGLLLVWGALFLDLMHQWGTLRLASSIPFQVCVVGAAGVFLLPATLLIPGFQHALVLIAERMALGVSVCVCALVGAARPRIWERYALVVVALIFFGFLYRDERAMNALEDRMQGAVAQSVPGHGVVIRGVKAGMPCGSTNWKALEDRRPRT
ncbi:MAG: hypothetical protein WBL65_10010 [Bryobacteraceae bacterium]